MNSSFDRCIDRTGTNSLKWDRYKGRDILPFWLADMDFQCAPAIVDALRKRMEHGVFGYTTPSEETVAAVLTYLREQKSIAAQAEWIVWTPGIVPSLGASCRAYAKRGEGVMMCTPVYPQFMMAPANHGRKAIKVPLARLGMHYSFDWEAMEAAADKAKAFLLCSPHNPVGRVFSYSELEKLVEFCTRKNIVICSDEIHCDLVIEKGLRHTSILAVKGATECSILLMAPSKTYNIPGLACAFAVIANKGLRDSFKRAIKGSSEWVNLFGLEACRAAYAECGDWHTELLDYLRDNRDYLRNYIAEHMPEIKVGAGEATYMAWLDVSELGLDNPTQFFEEAGIGFSDGADYGERCMLRMNYACPHSMLEKGLQRMEKAVKTLRSPAGPKSFQLAGQEEE